MIKQVTPIYHNNPIAARREKGMKGGLTGNFSLLTDMVRSPRLFVQLFVQRSVLASLLLTGLWPFSLTATG